MSDYAHNDYRSRMPIQHRTVESRALYGGCYVLFLGLAAIKRVAPWQRPSAFGGNARRDTIFAEASTAAGVVVSSCFTGM